MGKKQQKRNPPGLSAEVEIRSGEDGEAYAEYVKEHNKRLRRLEREAKGRNMEEPNGEY